jgi:hypothetical protein
MARLTLAHKITAVTLEILKKGANFDTQHLNGVCWIGVVRQPD